MTSALLSFYLPGHPATYLLPDFPTLNQLVLWPGYARNHSREDGLWVSDSATPPPDVAADFARVELLESHDASQDGRVVKRYYLYWCRRAGPSWKRAGPGPVLAGTTCPRPACSSG